MNSVELIRTFVLNETMDDYEEIEHITESVAKLGVKCGVAVQKEDVVRALISLTENGFARAYRLSNKTEEIKGVPSLEEIQNPDPYSRCYFWVTNNGKGEHKRLAWPFDDEGEFLGNSAR